MNKLKFSRYSLLCCMLLLNIFVGYGADQARADSLFVAKDYKQALMQYDTLLVSKSSSYLLYHKALCLYQLGQDKAAMPLFITLVNDDAYNVYDYIAYISFNNYEFNRAQKNMAVYVNKLNRADRRKVKTYRPRMRQNLFSSEALKADDLKVQFSKLCEGMIEKLRTVDHLSLRAVYRLPKASFLRAYTLSRDLGQLYLCRDWFKDDRSQDMTCYVSGRSDKMIFAQKDSTNQIDLMLAYSYLAGWSEAKSISPSINTPYNENYPYACSDGVTFYFASDRPGGLGGYDIYISSYNVGLNAYLKPSNMGMPYNSPYNDYLMVVDELQNVAWFVSDRASGLDSVTVYKYALSEGPKLDCSVSPELISKALLTTIDSTLLVELPQGNVTGSMVAGHQITGAAPQDSASTADTFHLIISDQVIYTRLSDFKSKAAQRFYLDRVKEEQTLQGSKTELQKLRESYAQAEAETNKNSIAQKIVDLEDKIYQSGQRINTLLDEIRTEELKAINP